MLRSVLRPVLRRLGARVVSIRRSHLAFEDKFVQVPNEWIRDSRISRKARGLLVEIMSHSPGWIVTLESLVGAGVEGREALRTAIKELEKFGYLERERERNSDGTLAGVDYVIRDPWSIEPTSDNPTLVDPPHKKTISQEHETQELSSKTSQSQSPLIAESGSTDSEVIEVTVMQEKLARNEGVTDLRAVVRTIKSWTGCEVTAAAALNISSWILNKAKFRPTSPQRYVIATIGRSPLEIQKHIHEQGYGS